MRARNPAWRRWRAAAGLAAALLLSACSASPLQSEDGRITLKLADSFPTKHPISEGGAKHFMSRAAELSGGRVQFDYFPAEQMGAAEDMVDLVQAGVVEIAMIAPAYVPAKLPLSGIADLPGMSETSCQGSLAVEKLVGEAGVLRREDFAKKDLRPLAVSVIPAYEVMTGDKEVREPSDVRGLQLRSSGGTIDRTVEALGAAPVSMPATDMYEAISRGIVDGTVLGPMSAHPYRLDEAAKNSTYGAQLGSWTATYSISERVWEQLPPDVQQVLTAAGRDTTRNMCRVIEEKNTAAREQMRASGMRFRQLTPEEKARWKAATEPVQQRWAQDMESIDLPGRQALEEFLAAREAVDEQGR